MRPERQAGAIVKSTPALAVWDEGAVCRWHHCPVLLRSHWQAESDMPARSRQGRERLRQ